MNVWLTGRRNPCKQASKITPRKKGYFELPHAPDLWNHVSQPISFTLVVDDFGIKYEGNGHANHLLGALTDYYKNGKRLGGLG